MALPKLPPIKIDPLTNKAYGFPKRGDKRRMKPTVLACVHITGNAHNQGSNAAQNERNFANRPDSPGPSAHFYLDRDGGGVKAINYKTFAAWSNGDLDHPNLANAGVKRVVSSHAHGYNPNESFVVEIECVGYAEVAGQITPAQIRRLGRIIARASAWSNLPINRNTVLAHADIDSVNRANCPALPRLRETTMNKIIAQAKAFKKTL